MIPHIQLFKATTWICDWERHELLRSLVFEALTHDAEVNITSETVAADFLEMPLQLVARNTKSLVDARLLIAHRAVSAPQAHRHRLRYDALRRQASVIKTAPPRLIIGNS